MAIELISQIIPKAGGSFPILEDIHLQGSLQIRATIVDRDAIPTLNRKEGMLVYVLADGQTYRLSGGLTNAFWVIDQTFNGGNGIAIANSSISIDLAAISGLQFVNGQLLLNLSPSFSLDAITGALTLAPNSISVGNIQYSNVLFEALTSTGVLDANGNTTFQLMSAPIIDPKINDGLALLVNGIDTQNFLPTVGAIPAQPGDWTFNATTLTVFGDVTGTNDKLRLRYLS